jgi:uncharacterized protein YeeX (DUF496 family)
MGGAAEPGRLACLSLKSAELDTQQETLRLSWFRLRCKKSATTLQSRRHRLLALHQASQKIQQKVTHMSAQSTIETMKANHEAAVDAGSGSNAIAALSRAREEMYFRAKDEELIKALNAKETKNQKIQKPRVKRNEQKQSAANEDESASS